ncbi:MAG: prepilin-type N-terminal cleavage/methylation domain-containing protein [Pirellulaceae bacterium]|nr:prepilin-type N-terminal cleavage/methylation domain-containing protein [Pirellulaceae bacterium]
MSSLFRTNADYSQPLPVKRMSGFTLLELLIVIVIMSIFASSAITFFQPNSKADIEAAANIIASELGYARSLAIQNRTQYRFTLNDDRTTLSLDHSGSRPAYNELPKRALISSNESETVDYLRLNELFPNHSSVQFIRMERVGPPAVVTTTLEFNEFGETTETATTRLWLGTNLTSGNLYLPLTISPTSGLVEIGEITTTSPE